MTRAAGTSLRGLAAAMIVTTVLSTLPAFAADLGVRGATWPVAEPDLLEQIEARLAAMQRSGEMARIEREAGSRARSRLEEPVPVPGIAPARETRIRSTPTGPSPATSQAGPGSTSTGRKGPMPAATGRP